MKTAAQADEIVHRRVRQYGVIKMIPERFHRIEFRGVWRQPFDTQPGAVFAKQFSNHPAPMRRKAIPDENDLLAAMTAQRPEKPRHMPRTDSAVMYGQKPANTSGIGSGEDRGNAGEAFPVERLANDRSLTTWRPCGADRWSLGKPRFVHKDQPCVQIQGVFFTRVEHGIDMVTPYW